jgi:hypothetical protein
MREYLMIELAYAVFAAAVVLTALAIGGIGS